MLQTFSVVEGRILQNTKNPHLSAELNFVRGCVMCAANSNPKHGLLALKNLIGRRVLTLAAKAENPLQAKAIETYLSAHMTKKTKSWAKTRKSAKIKYPVQNQQNNFQGKSGRIFRGGGSRGRGPGNRGRGGC